MKIGIVGAMDSEIKDILLEMQNVETVELSGQKFYSGIIGKRDVVLTKCGVGKVNAGIYTQLLITHFSPDCIINTGIAGNLKKTNKISDIIISTELTYHDIRGLTLDSFYPYQAYFYADTLLIEKLKKACALAGITRFKTGRIVSGDAFISNSTEKNRILEEYDAECVEMEGAAIGHTAFVNKIPFVVVRTISDDADEHSPNDFAAFEHETAKVSAKLVTAFILSLD